jgi:hypothetical protein
MANNYFNFQHAILTFLNTSNDSRNTLKMRSANNCRSTSADVCLSGEMWHVIDLANNTSYQDVQ